MTFRRVLRSKKGVEEESYKAMGGAVLGIFIAIAIISMIMGGGKIWAAEPDDVRLKDFKRDFVPLFESVVNGSSYDTRTRESYEVVEYLTIGPDQIIAVFGSNLNPLKDLCQRNENFEKPKECGKNVCVCLCSEKDSCKRPFECFPIKNANPQIIVADSNFDANLGDSYIFGGNYPLIYGDCDGAGGEPLGSRDILIEIVGNTHVIISDNTCRKNGGICMNLPVNSTCVGGKNLSFKCPHDRSTCCPP